MLAGLLMEGNDLPEAAALLREGVKVSPERSGLWMSLARLELEQADTAQAPRRSRRASPPPARMRSTTRSMRPCCNATGRHDDAVKHYLVALRSDPAMPNWLVGIGISLQATGRDGDAAEAFARAKNGGRLAPPLLGFVDQRLEQLKR
jgi:MSHA biogenesis protein MshN